MFEAEYLLFCAGKSTDDNGTLSLHAIFDKVYVEKFPAQHKPFYIVFKLRATEAIVNQHIKLRIATEHDGKEDNRLDIEGDFMVEKDNGLVPSFDVSQFVFPKAGIHQFKVYVNDKFMIERNLQIHPVAELAEQ